MRRQAGSLPLLFSRGIEGVAMGKGSTRPYMGCLRTSGAWAWIRSTA